MILDALLYVGIGFAAGCFFLWARYNVRAICYRLDDLEARGSSGTSRTDATGLEGDLENEEVKGSIGFHG